MMRETRYWIIGLLMLALAGCGFHLHGSAGQPLAFSTAMLDTATPLADEVAVLLRHNSVEIVTDRARADILIVISGEQYDRRVLSVSPTTGKVQEFELGLSTELTVRRADGSTVLENEKVTVIRDYSFDATAVLAKEGEESVLRAEIRQAAAESILRRLQAVK